MTKTFHMPAYAGEIFEEETEARFRKSFADLAKLCEPDEQPRFIQMLCFLPDDRGERCIPEKYLRIMGPTDERMLYDNDTKQQCLSELQAAWAMDRLAEQSITAHPLPWRTVDMGPRISNKYLAIHWSPSSILIAQEYLPTFLEDDDQDPIGAHWSRSYRTALASAIFPEAGSEHARLKRHQQIIQAKPEIEWLWTQMTLGCQDDISLDLSEMDQPTSLE